MRDCEHPAGCHNPGTYRVSGDSPPGGMWLCGYHHLQHRITAEKKARADLRRRASERVTS